MKRIIYVLNIVGAVLHFSSVKAQERELPLAGTSAVVDRGLYASHNSSLKGSEAEWPTAGITNALFGRIAGLGVAQSNGEPGYDAAKLSIRGVSTYGNTDIPVYVDGYQINPSFFNYMSAAEIEEIRILKDAAELAPFGMRGANGVIWVTTKRGTSSRPVVDFSLQSGIQQAVAIDKPLGTDDYCRLYNEAYSNDNGMVWNPFYTPAKTASLPDVDWYDATLKSVSPFTQTHVSVRGGSDNLRYFVAAGYMNQQGLYDVAMTDTTANAAIDRINIRANLDINLGKYVVANIGVGGRIENKRYPNKSAAALWDNMASYPSSVYPIKDKDGNWSGTPVHNDNPVAAVRALGRNSTHDRTFQFSLSLTEKLDVLLKGLYLKESVSISSWARDAAGNTRNYARYFNGTVQTTDTDTPYNKYEDSGKNQWNWKHFTATMGYDNNWGKHSLSCAVDALYNIYNTDINQNSDAGAHIYYRHANISGAASYAYDKRLSATLVFAAGGSDNYRPGNNWGFYPAASIAYNVLDRRNSIPSVDLLKLRASAGLNGWDPMGEKRFLWESYHYSNGGLNLGNGSPSWNSGFAPMYEANPDIFAESSAKYDIGAEGEFFGKTLSFDITAFYEKRKGIVTQNHMLPGSAGIANPAYENIGKVSNYGADFTLRYAGHTGDFGYGASFIGSYATNRIDYMAEVITVASMAQTGHPIGSIYGFVGQGFYDVDDFDSECNLLPDFPTVTLGKVQPGDLRYKDLNNDNVIDELDKTVIGKPSLPKFNYSFSLNFSYKGFDLGVLFQGTGGRDVNLLDAPLQNVAFRNNGNVFGIAQERWAYYPSEGIDTRTNASYPRLSLQDNNNNYSNSTFWIRNGDFLKLRNVEFGYSFRGNWMQKVSISNLRLYFQGLNLLTFSKLKREYDIDPEVLSGHPALKSYIFGLNISF